MKSHEVGLRKKILTILVLNYMFSETALLAGDFDDSEPFGRAVIESHACLKG